MAQTKNSSIKMQIRTEKGAYICAVCGGTLQKDGITTNGKYQRFQCQNCSKKWNEMQ